MCVQCAKMAQLLGGRYTFFVLYLPHHEMCLFWNGRSGAPVCGGDLSPAKPMNSEARVFTCEDIRPDERTATSRIDNCVRST
jgi:hypothetical protein